MSKTWVSFWWSIVIGILILTALMIVLPNKLAAFLLGLGLWGVIYFIVVGLTSISRNLRATRELLERIRDQS